MPTYILFKINIYEENIPFYSAKISYKVAVDCEELFLEAMLKKKTDWDDGLVQLTWVSLPWWQKTSSYNYL